jgi:AbrB family looped-hinge helix DNA binding protein
MAVSTVTSKGQITIPKSIRERLQLHPGDRVDFIVEKEGKVVLEPATMDVQELEGLLHKSGRKKVTIKDMKLAIKQRYGKRIK